MKPDKGPVYNRGQLHTKCVHIYILLLLHQEFIVKFPGYFFLLALLILLEAESANCPMLAGD